MRTAWPARAVRDALGRAPDRRQPARESRQTPAGDARRHSGNRHRGGIRTGSGPVVTRSAALGLPITRPSALRSGPIGLHQVRRSPCRRPLGPRSARHRLVTGPRRPAQGPPAPTPATPAQFPHAHCARGPMAAHTHDGFLILDLELKLVWGTRGQGPARFVRNPRPSEESESEPARNSVGDDLAASPVCRQLLAPTVTRQQKLTPWRHRKLTPLRPRRRSGR